MKGAIARLTVTIEDDTHTPVSPGINGGDVVNDRNLILANIKDDRERVVYMVIRYDAIEFQFSPQHQSSFVPPTPIEA